LKGPAWVAAYAGMTNYDTVPEGRCRGEDEEGSHFNQLITPSPLSPVGGGNSTFYEIINF
jgi:hypothetical protein